LGDFERVVELYSDAVDIFEERVGENSKQVAQLTMWMVAAHMWLGDMVTATELNERATALVKKVFGDISWEAHRALLDRVYILQHSFDPNNSTQASEARKAFSMAERVETHATILANNLASEKIADDKVESAKLSTFAPIRRDELIKQQSDKPFVRPGKEPSTGAMPPPSSKGKPTVGFKGDTAQAPSRRASMAAKGAASNPALKRAETSDDGGKQKRKSHAGTSKDSP